MTSSSATLQEIINILNDIAPFSYAEDWDNVGLMIGDPNLGITGIIAGLDPTAELLTEAQDINANLIITHHPSIFHPLKNIQLNQPDGAFISLAIQADIAVVACHTNLDIVEGGVNTALANRLGLLDTKALIPASCPPPANGLGLTGKLARRQKAEVFLTTICRELDLPTISISGKIPETIERVAVCGGSGSEFAPQARQAGADIYITGEVKHSTARWAEAAGFCIIDAGHFGTENVVIPELVKILSSKILKNGINIPVRKSIKQQSPTALFYPLTS